MYNKEINVSFYMQYDDSVMALLKKAEQFKVQRKFKDAIEVLNKAVLIEPDCVEAYEEIGDNFISLRENDRSEKSLAQAIKINPTSPNAHYLMGFLYSVEQKWNKSIAELQTADKLCPNHPEILRCLGWSLYNHQRRSQGIAVLERSHTLKPSDPNILCDLGVCYMNNLSFDKAEEKFKRVIRLYPESDQARECMSFLQILKLKDFA